MTIATPTRHPCEGMSNAAIAVFEQTAVGKYLTHPQSEALLARIDAATPQPVARTRMARHDR